LWFKRSKKGSYMKEITLDCNGLACPAPVLRCKSCVEEHAPEILVVSVDNGAAKENVTRFLGIKGYAVAAEKNGDQWTLTARRTAEAADDAAKAASSAPAEDRPAAPASVEKTVAFITAGTIGRGDDELGAKLMVNFLSTLPELGESLWRIILVNGGVTLTVPGGPAFEKLKALAEAGVEILVCGACLEFFGLLEKKEVGQTTNMLDVVTSLQLASKVIQV